VGTEGLSDDAKHLQIAVAITSGGIVGYLVMALGVNVLIEAGCKTLLVCFSEDPEHLKEVDPELYVAFSGKAAEGKAKDATNQVGQVNTQVELARP